VAEFFFRHHAPRPHQQELMEDAFDALSCGKSLLANAATGCGKTDAVLSAAISYAHETDLTIFFLTPKISQHKIAVDVVNGIAQKHKLGIRAVDLIGRRHACIDPVLGDLDHDGFYQSCEKKRKNETCAFYCNARGFNKAQEAKANMLFRKMLDSYGAARPHQDVVRLGAQVGCCPYEWLIKLAGASNVIIADYYHFMIPEIRDILLLKAKKKIENSIVIVDEAHNLGRRVREHLSSSVSSYVFARAEKEMRFLGADPLPLEAGFNKWAQERLGKTNEKLVSRLGFDNLLLDFGTEQELLAKHFEELGLEFVERTNRKSACLRLSRFISGWKSEEEGVVRILKGRNGWFGLSKRFLDPSIATSVLNKCHSSILMSGTLLPLEMHRDTLGLDAESTMMKSYPSPFDRNNTMHIITEGHTTRYSERKAENYAAMAGQIDRIISSTPGGTAVFFPSYSVQNAVLPFIKSGNLHVQRENAGPDEVAELLRRFGSGGVLVGVQGGSMSEGVDYCNEEIKTAVIVGIALEEMSLEIQALIDYYQEKFGRGWEYGYMWPAVIKAMQAAGRGIRKETDRCAVVYMDERFAWKNYKSVFGSGTSFIMTSEPERYVKEFWGNAHASH
jgi:DNA excision repair protein ERCC-2